MRDNEQTLKIELLSHWKLEAEFRNLYGKNLEPIWVEAANRKDLCVCFLWTPQIGQLRQFMVNSGESVSSTKSLERDKKHGVDIYLLKVIFDVGRPQSQL